MGRKLKAAEAGAGRSGGVGGSGAEREAAGEAGVVNLRSVMAGEKTDTGSNAGGEECLSSKFLCKPTVERDMRGDGMDAVAAKLERFAWSSTKDTKVMDYGKDVFAKYSSMSVGMERTVLEIGPEIEIREERESAGNHTQTFSEREIMEVSEVGDGGNLQWMVRMVGSWLGLL